MQLRKLLFRNSRFGKNNYLSPEDFLNQSRMLSVTWFGIRHATFTYVDPYVCNI